jgi:hypothetical protein
MTASVAIAIVIVCALLAANWPFVTRRWFLCIPLKSDKGLALRGAELLVLYGLVGAIGLLLERHLGQIAPQGWEFSAVTLSLFVTLAFPGFVLRHLVKWRKVQATDAA